MRMKKTPIFLALAAMLLTSGNLYSQQPSNAFQEAVKLYENGAFGSERNIFEKLSDPLSKAYSPSRAGMPTIPSACRNSRKSPRKMCFLPRSTSPPATISSKMPITTVPPLNFTRWRNRASLPGRWPGSYSRKRIAPLPRTSIRMPSPISRGSCQCPFRYIRPRRNMPSGTSLIAKVTSRRRRAGLPRAARTAASRLSATTTTWNAASWTRTMIS